MDNLETLVGKLKNEANDKEIVKILQRIEKIILNNYYVKIGETKIEPLLIEAYYYHPEYYTDLAVHSAKESGQIAAHAKKRQRKNFGKAYIHRPIGDGIDVCMSDCEDFYLSFLIKNAVINGEFCTQFGVADAVCENCNKCGKKVEDCVYNDSNVLIEREEKDKKQYSVVYLPRKGIVGNSACVPFAALPIERIMDNGHEYTLPTGYSLQWRAAVKALFDLNGRTDLSSVREYIKAKGWCESNISESYWLLAKESLGIE